MLDITIPDDSFTKELQRIRGLIEAGELPAAARALNVAQRKAPRDARVPLVGMRMAQRAGNVKGAISTARRALDLAPQWPVAMLELGALLASAGEPQQGQEAMRLAHQAVALEPDDAQVLSNAAGIATACGDVPRAFEWVRRGVDRSPDNPRLRLALAQMLAAARQPAEAKAQFDQLAERFPGDPAVVLGQLGCALATGQPEAARQYADRALALRPDDANARYWHAVAHGRTPPTQPAASIASLYDSYAPGFDAHLAHDLHYRLPERIGQLLRSLYPDLRFNVLDLGCGTGLVGACLGRIKGHIVGVDLSARMIQQAQRRGVYSKFHRVNLLDALAHTPAGHYEVITCADALIHVGELTPVVQGAWRVLKAGGYFIFSCEAAREGEPDLALRLDGNRYAHRDTAVETLCRQAGFAEVGIEQLPMLRLEGDAPLPGFLVVARKPAAA